jgi:hypothetical protein
LRTGAVQERYAELMQDNLFIDTVTAKEKSLLSSYYAEIEKAVMSDSHGFYNHKEFKNEESYLKDFIDDIADYVKAKY